MTDQNINGMVSFSSPDELPSWLSRPPVSNFASWRPARHSRGYQSPHAFQLHQQILSPILKRSHGSTSYPELTTLTCREPPVDPLTLTGEAYVRFLWTCDPGPRSPEQQVKVAHPPLRRIVMWVVGLAMGIWDGLRALSGTGKENCRGLWDRVRERAWKGTWDKDDIRGWLWQRRVEIVVAFVTVVLLCDVEWFEMELREGCNEGGHAGGKDEPLFIITLWWTEGMSKLFLIRHFAT